MTTKTKARGTQIVSDMLTLALKAINAVLGETAERIP